MRSSFDLLYLEPSALDSLALRQVAIWQGSPKAEADEPRIPQPYLLTTAGQQLHGDAMHAALASSGSSANMLAVVPLRGVLSPDGEYYGTSLTQFARAVQQLDASPQVHTILLAVKSPGGTVTGTLEAGDAVRKVRERGDTSIVTHADGMMASAATWIGTAASEVVLTRSGEAGSIGVISMYAEFSKMLEDAGIKLSVARVPEKKARFSGLEPMTDDMREHQQQRVQEAYQRFLRAMADNRGVRIDQVKAKFGGGEMMKAEDAKEAGLVDRLGSFDETVARLMRSGRKPATVRNRNRQALAEAQ